MKDTDPDAAIALLEKGREDWIDPEEPEDMDFEQLDELRDVYRETKQHDKAADLTSFCQDLEDVDKCRSFVLLAKAHLRKAGWDARGALGVAMAVKKQDSRHYLEAEQL